MIILSWSIYDKKGLHWCWNTNKIPLNRSVVSQKTRIENDSKKTRTRAQASKGSGTAGGGGKNAYCKEAKWMSIGTVWEKSGVTVYKRHNATRSRLYVPNGSNREPSFAISSRILLFLFPLSFAACSLFFLPFQSEDAHVCLPLASQRSMQETVRMRRAEDDAQSEV